MYGEEAMLRGSTTCDVNAANLDHRIVKMYVQNAEAIIQLYMLPCLIMDVKLRVQAHVLVSTDCIIVEHYESSPKQYLELMEPQYGKASMKATI